MAIALACGAALCSVQPCALVTAGIGHMLHATAALLMVQSGSAMVVAQTVQSGSAMVVNQTVCSDKCVTDCRTYLLPAAQCFSPHLLFPGDAQWGRSDVRDVPVNGTIVRSFFVSVDSSCENRSDGFAIPTGVCVGPFGQPRPWGRFVVQSSVGKERTRLRDNATARGAPPPLPLLSQAAGLTATSTRAARLLDDTSAATTTADIAQPPLSSPHARHPHHPPSHPHHPRHPPPHPHHPHHPPPHPHRPRHPPPLPHPPRHPPPLRQPPPPAQNAYAMTARKAAAAAAEAGETLVRCPTEGAYAAPWHSSQRLCREPTTGTCNSSFKLGARLSGHGKCFPDGDPLVGAAIMWGGFGCYPGLDMIWVTNRCAGRFSCENGRSIACGSSKDNKHTNCSCV